MTEKAIAAVSGLPTFFADAISSYRVSVAKVIVGDRELRTAAARLKVPTAHLNETKRFWGGAARRLRGAGTGLVDEALLSS
jgi:hypothetical protein